MKKVLLIAVLTMVIAGLSFAQTDIGFYGIGPKLGFTGASGPGTNLTFGGAVDMGSLMNEQVGLQADVTYWGKSDHGFKWSEIAISVIGKYFFAEPGEQLRPWAGGGLGLHISSWSVDWGEYLGGKHTYSSTDIGFQVGGGADYQLSDSMKGIGEFRYNLGGNWNYWSVFAGVIFQLGK